MTPGLLPEEQALLDRALRAARDTRHLAVEAGARHDTARVFASAFGDGPAAIVAALICARKKPAKPAGVKAA